MTTVPTSLMAAAERVEPSWDDERAERNLARIHRRRRVRARALGVSVLLSACAAAAFVLWALPERPLVVAGAPPTSLTSTAIRSATTTFSDGSLARVGEGGELSVTSASPARIESRLVRGAAEFEVAKRAERDFIVVAGSVRVRVVGTRFRIELVGERTRVSVSEGKVEVQHGTALTSLEAGESRFYPSAPDAPRADGTRAPAAEPSAAAGPAVASRARFLELARGGEYRAAYQVMSQSPFVVGSSAEELMLAADAARLSNHPEQALGYLRRVTREHASDSRAPLAAFTMGRVLLSQLSRPAQAAEAFALARRLQPSGGLSEDALAREAEASATAGAGARAASLARQYLERYPAGKHRRTMLRLGEQP
jgi:transmembrane sensor